jgi:hypothetical protein
LLALTPAAESFADFIADENNSYRKTLTNALEDEDQFLDRRSRMLDHLLSRLGESMDDLAAMAYRESYNVPNASGLTWKNYRHCRKNAYCHNEAFIKRKIRFLLCSSFTS